MVYGHSLPILGLNDITIVFSGYRFIYRINLSRKHLNTIYHPAELLWYIFGGLCANCAVCHMLGLTTRNPRCGDQGRSWERYNFATKDGILYHGVLKTRNFIITIISIKFGNIAKRVMGKVWSGCKLQVSALGVKSLIDKFCAICQVGMNYRIYRVGSKAPT